MITETYNPASALEDLKILIEEYAHYTEKAQNALPRIWIATTRWADYRVENGASKSNNDALVTLGNSLHRSLSSCQEWYHNGAFMLREDLSPGKHCSQSIRVLRSNWLAITKAEQLRGLDLIKRATVSPYQQVQKIIRLSKTLNTRGAERRAARLANHGELTKTRVKMDAMALQTLARKWHGEHVSIYIMDDEGNTLVEVE